MKHKEMTVIVEEAFKVINKLSRKIIKEFNANDINYFRIEVKKLRAFLRMIHANDEYGKSIIPKLLKTFYGYIGIVHNIQLQKNRLFEYTTKCKVSSPKEYTDILNKEKSYWQNNILILMENNNFNKEKEEITRHLPDKINKNQIKKFVESKLRSLKTSVDNLEDKSEIHTARKILNDLLYTWNYINDKSIFPKKISNEEKLKLITEISGDFRDICIELGFMQPGYFDQIRDENEKEVLSGFHITLQLEKEHLTEKVLRWK